MGAWSNKIVSVVVATCANGGYLKKCLDSLTTQTYPEMEIIVIDNSLDVSLSRDINMDYPFVKLYFSKDRLSYCKSLNKGISLSSGNFILCLNDDSALDRSFIAEALRGFLLDSKVGIVSGKILRSDGKTIDSTGLFLSFFRTAKERGYGIQDKGQFDKAGFIFGVNGAVAFYRKELLEDIKQGEDYFDSDFHFFYEDLDIAWRAKRAGWKAYYIPPAIAYHVRGATLRLSCGINKPFARRFLSDELHLDLIKNRYLSIIKNESCLNFLLHLPGILLYDLGMWIYLLCFKAKLIKMFISSTEYLNSALKKRGIAKNN